MSRFYIHTPSGLEKIGTRILDDGGEIPNHHQSKPKTKKKISEKKK